MGSNDSWSASSPRRTPGTGRPTRASSTPGWSGPSSTTARSAGSSGARTSGRHRRRLRRHRHRLLLPRHDGRPRARPGRDPAGQRRRRALPGRLRRRGRSHPARVGVPAGAGMTRRAGGMPGRDAPRAGGGASLPGSGARRLAGTAPVTGRDGRARGGAGGAPGTVRGGACPNLLQRRPATGSAERRSAEYQRFSSGAPARSGPLQQIWTTDPPVD